MSVSSTADGFESSPVAIAGGCDDGEPSPMFILYLLRLLPLLIAIVYRYVAVVRIVIDFFYYFTMLLWGR